MVNFEDMLKLWEELGGFAQIKTYVDYLRESFGADKTLLMDGGDTWQGSATLYGQESKIWLEL